ncbi:hypothetical protein DFP72DRAFT_147045 [Ephemerocybe angulata]|uniref:BTB domain-containing protein n=1 Tax=Ephemerocybe angulata TaxID=980116 RepID=A0A8H6HBH6_9AGAR|nr:hypothetical protein DFP72DRAFT_147045 [Tulosesus angulatus]
MASTIIDVGTTESIRGTFYFEFVTLKVQDTIHRIPKRILEEWSQIFKDMFGIPQEDGNSEGSSDENPIILPGCTNAEFESLMKVLLTPTSIKPLVLSKDQWIGVLKLSTMWDMVVVRKHAIAMLSPLIEEHTPIEQVVLGKQFKVASWFTQGCASLASAHKTLDLHSVAKALGWEFVARILRIGSSETEPAAIADTVELSHASLKFKCKNCKAPIATSTTTDNKRSEPINLFGHIQQRWETNIRYSCTGRVGCSGVSGMSSILLEQQIIRVQTPNLAASISQAFKEELRDMYL